MSAPAGATTSLAIVISGEPWKDPSLAATGHKLSVSTPPVDGQIWLGWSTTSVGAMGVNWQISKASNPPVPILSGQAKLPQPALPGTQYWISVPAKFLAAKPPAKAAEYRITVTPYDAKGAPIGLVSAPVTQEVDSSKGPALGRAAVFPTLEVVSYLPQIGIVQNTQLRYALGTLTVRARNAGTVPTDAMLLYAKDLNGLFRQDVPVPIATLAPHAARDLTLNLKAVLPPAQSQLPEDKQYGQWQKDYAEKCGVDFRAVMDLDMRASEASSLMNTHREASVYKGIGGSTFIVPVKQEVPLCDEKHCVLMSDVAKNIRSQLDSKVVGYAFYLGGCSSIRSEAYGSARTSADSAAGFTPSTKMTVASVSKVVTALAAIRVIAERRHVDPNLQHGLDSPIGPFLPPWNWAKPDQEKIAAITFRRLLSQTSGIRNYGNFPMDYATLKKFFSKPVRSGAGPCGGTDIEDVDGIDPAIVTDTAPCYSNINFAIFRILLPRIMGYGGDDEGEYAARYVQIVQDKVFKPVGIMDADCKPPSKGAYALAYTFPGTSSWDFGDRRSTCGGEGWYLSVEDLGAVLLSINGVDGRILDVPLLHNMETIPALHALGWDCPSTNCPSLSGYRWLEKNGALQHAKPGPKVNTSIAIFGGASGTPFAPGAIGVLFANSDIANAPDLDVSAVLGKAFSDAVKPRTLSGK